MIDDAMIKRVADESGAEAWWVSGNEDAVEFYAILHQFARSIEQLVRQGQREEVITLCGEFANTLDSNDYGGRGAVSELTEAIRTSGKENSNDTE